MILLDTTTRKLQVVLSAAKTTNDCPWVTAYVDITTTAAGIGASSNGVSNGLTSVDIVGVPGGSTTRKILEISLYNADTVLITLTINYNDNGTTRVLWYGSLNVGDTLHYCDEQGFYVMDSGGNRKSITGSASFSGLAFPGRLTPHGSAAVPAADAVGVTSIDYLPAPNAVGYLLPIYNGTSFLGYSITSSGLTLTLNTSNHLSGKLYDVFAIYSGGSLVLVSGPAWTSNTARSQAITQATGNIWTNNTAMTAYNGSTSYSVAQYQGTYLGTFYASANGQSGIKLGATAAIGGSAPVCFIWNAYNQVAGAFACRDSTASYTYQTAAWRQRNGSTGNQFSFICGLVVNGISGASSAQCSQSASVGVDIAMGLNSTTAPYGGTVGFINSTSTVANQGFSHFNLSVAIGYNYIADLEYSPASGTTTWSDSGNVGTLYTFWY